MFKKYASVEEILEVKSLPERIGFAFGEEAGNRLVRFAAAKDHKEQDGYLYVRCRAISSRVNKNNDGWPAEELALSYKSFIGKPIFVDHNNEDPARTRGVIVDAQLHVDDPEKASAFDPYYSTAPDNHKPPTWIELLMEVDAKTYPKLAEAIKNGDMDAVSMGANIEKSVCSVCANEAATPTEYCSHVKQKGVTFEITSDNGEKVKKKAYEDCYGIGFFEISNVFDPADPTADSWLDNEQRAARVVAKAEAEGVDPAEVLAYIGLKQEGILAKAASTGKPLSQEVMNKLSAAALPETFDDHGMTYPYPSSQYVCPNDSFPLQAIGHKGSATYYVCHHCGENFSDLNSQGVYQNLPRGSSVDKESGIRFIAEPIIRDQGEKSGYVRASMILQSMAQGRPVEDLVGYNDPVVQNVVQQFLSQNDNDPARAAQAIEEAFWGQSVSRTAHPADQFVQPVDGDQSPEHERNYEPQGDMVTAPQDVDTLRSEHLCPVCKAADMETDPDGIIRCPTCGHVQEPKPVDNPDLGIARDVELRQDSLDSPAPEGDNAVPAANPLDNVSFTPVDNHAPVAATKDSTTNEGISEMFTLKLRTSKKEEADALVPVEQKTARVELKLGSKGIHRGIYDAAREAGLSVKVTYPTIDDEENFVEVPGENGVFNLFFAQESAAKLRVPMSEVPIIVEASSDEDLEKFKSLLETTERPTREAAQKQKSTILPEGSKQSDEPKDVVVVKDELQPRETRVLTIGDDVVELDGKKYHLTEFTEDEPKAEDEKDDEKLDTSKAEDLAKEVADEKDEDEEDDKESKLLAAFKVADMAVELGLITSDDKMAYIAELEEDNLKTLETREATMKQVKTAGLSRKSARKVGGVKRIPRLSHAVIASTNGGTLDTTPDEALFL